jgi:cytochrome bd-type quinol oxidase subunit 2
MSPILYWTLLILSCGYALYRGERHARVVAAICVIGTIVSISVDSPASNRYASVETGALIVDIGVLIAFALVALRSDRFWPLWVAGLQLTTSFAHLLKAMDPQLIPPAYGAAARFWSYPILIILAVGTWRQHRRSRLVREAGTVPC